MDDVTPDKRKGRGPRRRRPRASASAAKKARWVCDPVVAERQSRAYDFRVAGLTFAQIGLALGCDRDTASRYVIAETERRVGERAVDRASLIESQASRYEWIVATLRGDIAKLAEDAAAAHVRGEYRHAAALRAVRATSIRTLSAALANVDQLFGLRTITVEVNSRAPVVEAALAIVAGLSTEQRIELFRRGEAARIERMEKNVTP